MPVWISDLSVTPSMPIHVADASSPAEGRTAGTFHRASTPVNVDPPAMYPDQFVECDVAPVPTAGRSSPGTARSGVECCHRAARIRVDPQVAKPGPGAAPAACAPAAWTTAAPTGVASTANTARTVADRRRRWNIGPPVVP